MQSALLWYELFTSTLEGMGFVLNPYDLCVANKIINGKQCTICWYVDDLKISHITVKVVDDVIAAIETKFGKMTVNRGNKHTYVGMNIEFIGKKVQILMIDHLKEAIEDFGEPIPTEKVNSPAMRGLFVLDKNAPLLDKERGDRYGSIVGKLLFVSKHARPDPSLTISFLCTRVKFPDTSDWQKLKRLLQYIQCTLDMPYTLSAENGMTILSSWIDASYAIHHDMRGHTGGAMSFGQVPD